MVRQKLSRFAFYRFRYPLAYAAFAVAMASMLLVAGFYLPGGLTETEMRSALISDNLSPAALFNLKPEELIYLPYRLLQAATISVFGISVIGIKLPSILLGFASALGILYLLNLWYSRNVAIIAAIIAVTTNQFLLSSQAGQAGIAYIFLTVSILIAASMIAGGSVYAKFCILAGFILAGISLYFPLNAYILVALVATALIHPHARHLLLRESPKKIVTLGVVLFLVIISPLVMGIVNNLEVLWTLLGVSDGISEFSRNASLLLSSYASFASPTSGTTITPVYGLGLVLLIGLGLYRLISAKYTAKSYVISFWLVLLVPLVCLNPGFVSITFIPVVLLIALAVDYLISSWYRLFPRNPYARIFGLLPLGVLVVGLVVSSIDRYVYGLHYDKAVYATYSYDLSILSKKLRSLENDDTIQLVVTAKNVPFYQSFARHQSYVKRLDVTSHLTDVSKAPITIVERAAKPEDGKLPSEILVTRTADQADRFYLYKNK
jgi:hypothetical protein